MIPKIIWQTHEWEYELLPDHIKKVAENWQKLNPGYEYRYHSSKQREAEIEKFDRLLLQYHKLARPGVQSDIWRAIVIYKYGGYYADMDSICISPIDYVLQQHYTGKGIITRAPGGIPRSDGGIDLELESSNFGSIPQHQAFADIISALKEKFYKFTIQDIAQDDLVLWCGPDKYSNGNIMYSDNVLKYKDDVCFEFSKASYHYGAQGKFNDYKHKFDDTFIVDYFGEKIRYCDLVSQNGTLV